MERLDPKLYTVHTHTHTQDHNSEVTRTLIGGIPGILGIQVGVERTSWHDVRQGEAIDESKYKQEMEECCNEDELDWGNLRCSMQSFMEPNYTAAAFPSMGQG